jgi:hypothetical protein
MNAPSISRRLALFLLVGITSLSACKKDTEPVASGDLGTRAAGTYTLTELSGGGKTIPAAQADLKGSISVVRQTATSVDLNFDIREKSTNDEVLVGSADGLEVSSAGGNKISFKGDNAEVATLDGNRLSIKIEDSNGVDVTFVAVK